MARQEDGGFTGKEGAPLLPARSTSPFDGLRVVSKVEPLRAPSLSWGCQPGVGPRFSRSEIEAETAVVGRRCKKAARQGGESNGYKL